MGAKVLSFVGAGLAGDSACAGRVGHLCAGHSRCREQANSAQGRLERVLHTGDQPFPSDKT